MAISESQLETWSHQGSMTQSSTTYQTVRTALQDSRAVYADQSFNLPTSLSVAVSHNLIGPITVTGDARYGLHERKMNLSLGGEFNFSNVASFRIGYLSQNGTSSSSGGKSGLDGLGGLGMGIGLKLFSHLTLDYAFVPMGELGGTHHADFIWRFK